jgi:hypothetical protein
VGKQHSLSMAIASGVCASMLILAGCNQQPAQNQGSAPASSASAPASSATAGQQQAAYTPPTADQLYQMVAPIALFPDKLVAQVLAGSTYPDQVTAAENLVTQNPNLKGDMLQAAVQPQSWDASVKGLTQFPSVLSQMAQNIQWTTALGEAYVNDPTDVLNAIQVMRQRARSQGNLQSSTQQAVSVQPVQQVQASEQQAGYEVASDAPPVYSGPDVVPPPQQIIQIEPSQPDAVYVPAYDPQTVYGGDVPVYPSYEYVQPTYTTGEVVAVGAVAFGAAIVVGALLDHHGGGWHSWGMNWGGGYNGGGGGGYNGGYGGGGGWHRPAVVYNNQTYVSRSTTVINRYTNINNVTNNVTNNRYNTINNNTVNNNNVNTINRTVNNNNVANNFTNNRNEFNRNVTNNVTNNHPAAQPMSVPNFARAGYPAAQVPHAAAPEQHLGAAPTRLNEAAHQPAANVAHPQPAQAAERPAFAPRPQEAVRQPAPQAHPAPQAQPHPQPAFHPAPQAQPHPQPAPRPAPQEHPQPAFHPAPQAQPHPQPAPRPAPQEHPQPAPHPAPQAQPHPQPQAHPAPQQHQSPPPPKKKDESHN